MVVRGHHHFGVNRPGCVGGMEVHGDRLLGEVRMLGALVDLELGGHLAAKLGLGQHALDGLLDDGFGATGEELDEGLFAETTGEAGVAAIELLVSLEAGQHDLFGVDDDDVIAHIDVRGVEGAELAGEDRGSLGGETAERFAAGVEHEPLALNIFAARDSGGHRLGYSLILPSSVFGLVRKNVVLSWWFVKLLKSKRTIVPEQSGVAKEETHSLFTRRVEIPLWPGWSDLV
jgi:hypothetical protein